MKIPFLMVRDFDALILGTLWHDDPDNGPTKPQHAPPPGVTLVPGELSRAGRRDSEAAYWRGVDGVEWVETSTLDQARAEAWTAAKNARVEAEAEPFEFEGGMYDPNKENVSGAALAALLAQLGGLEVSRTWTLADNSRRVLTGAQIIAMGLALTARVDAIHERGRMLRDLIDNATTSAEAYGYTWNSLDA
jgi:hypothetical protein